VQELANAVLSEEGFALVKEAGDVIGEDRDVGAYVMYPTSLKGKSRSISHQLYIKMGSLTLPRRTSLEAKQYTTRQQGDMRMSVIFLGPIGFQKKND
jgi:hypothetical protein